MSTNLGCPIGCTFAVSALELSLRCPAQLATELHIPRPSVWTNKNGVLPPSSLYFYIFLHTFTILTIFLGYLDVFGGSSESGVPDLQVAVVATRDPLPSTQNRF